MKNKKFIWILAFVLILGTLLVACAPEEAPPKEDVVLEEDLTLDFRYIRDKFIQDEKNFLVMSSEGEDINLEVEDLELHDSLELEEFYLIAYNDDMILRSIEKDPYLKRLVLSSMEQGVEDEIIEIKPQAKLDLDNLTLLDQYLYDFNLNGFEEEISMYTSAQKDPDGNVMWDDGQRWVFIIEGEDEDYVLFDGYVQIGKIDFHIYTEDNKFNILTSQVGTANLTLFNYEYNDENGVFEKTKVFDTSGNVNMLHNSYGY